MTKLMLFQFENVRNTVIQSLIDQIDELKGVSVNNADYWWMAISIEGDHTHPEVIRELIWDCNNGAMCEFKELSEDLFDAYL